MIERSPIYLAGFPKSGNTWATRLLADVLNCAAGGCRPEDDEREPATTGLDRPKPYVVRKGHFLPTGDLVSPAVYREHRISLRALVGKTTPVIHIVRHPCDIVVSGAHYWRNSIDVQLDAVIRGHGPMNFHGPWTSFITAWLEAEERFDFIYRISYEALLRDPVSEVKSMIDFLQQGFFIRAFDRIDAYSRAAQAVSRNSFQSMKANEGAPFWKHFLRRGVVGDWKSAFGKDNTVAARIAFDAVASRLGYEL
jgi:hypothetical protein